MRTQELAKRASGVAMRRSQARARSSPPPRATPLTAARTGTGQSWNALMLAWPDLYTSSVAAAPSRATLIPKRRSPPAQNAGGVPVRTTSRVSAPSTAVTAAVSALMTSAVMALRRSGRLIVRIRAGPRRSAINSSAMSACYAGAALEFLGDVASLERRAGDPARPGAAPVAFTALPILRREQVADGQAPVRPPAVRELDQLLVGWQVVECILSLDRAPQRQVAGEEHVGPVEGDQ